jgi:hypothetical protein
VIRGRAGNRRFDRRRALALQPTNLPFTFEDALLLVMPMIRKRPISGGVPEENELTPTQIEEFAHKARWEVRQEDMRANRSRCMDGRYKPGAGVIAMPGADVGLLAIGLVAAESIARRSGRTVPDQELYEIVFDAIGGRSNFSYQRIECRSSATTTGLTDAATADFLQTVRVYLGRMRWKSVSLPHCKHCWARWKASMSNRTFCEAATTNAQFLSCRTLTTSLAVAPLLLMSFGD